jgi:hypothetical protein
MLRKFKGIRCHPQHAMQAIPVQHRKAMLSEHGVELTTSHTTSFQKALREHLPDDLLAAIVQVQEEGGNALLRGEAEVAADQAHVLQTLRQATQTIPLAAATGALNGWAESVLAQCGHAETVHSVALFQASSFLRLSAVSVFADWGPHVECV